MEKDMNLIDVTELTYLQSNLSDRMSQLPSTQQTPSPSSRSWAEMAEDEDEDEAPRARDRRDEDRDYYEIPRSSSNRSFARGNRPRGNSPAPGRRDEGRDYYEIPRSDRSRRSARGNRSRGNSPGPNRSRGNSPARGRPLPLDIEIRAETLRNPDFSRNMDHNFIGNWKECCHLLPPLRIIEIYDRAKESEKLDSCMFFIASLMENPNFCEVMSDSTFAATIQEDTGVRFSTGPLQKCEQFEIKGREAIACDNTGCSYYETNGVRFYCPKHICTLVKTRKEPRDEEGLFKLFNIIRG
jgi:hypothetical protein